MSLGTIKTTVTCELYSRIKEYKTNYHNPAVILADVRESFAQYYGFKNWNTAYAILKDKPFNPSIYPAEDSEVMDKIINKVLDKRRKKCAIPYKKGHSYITFLKKFHEYKELKKYSILPPINWDDFWKIKFKFSDEYILSVNKMLASVYKTGAL